MSMLSGNTALYQPVSPANAVNGLAVEAVRELYEEIFARPWYKLPSSQAYGNEGVLPICRSKGAASVYGMQSAVSKESVEY
jgi:hypothetical protein